MRNFEIAGKEKPIKRKVELLEYENYIDLTINGAVIVRLRDEHLEVYSESWLKSLGLKRIAH